MEFSCTYIVKACAVPAMNTNPNIDVVQLILWWPNRICKRRFWTLTKFHARELCAYGITRGHATDTLLTFVQYFGLTFFPSIGTVYAYAKCFAYRTHYVLYDDNITPKIGSSFFNFFLIPCVRTDDELILIWTSYSTR